MPQTNTRQPAVAGMFYPADMQTLHDDVVGYLSSAKIDDDVITRPVAIIAPHAGYIYSGPIAASAYARLTPFKDKISRVVLLGPCHRVPLSGVAASSAEYFNTPLGNIAIDTQAVNELIQTSLVKVLDEAHALEHSLEVHLPFLQEVLTDFKLIPLVVGETPPETVAKILEQLWQSQNTLIVVSSDLSHYESYNTARVLDKKTSDNIENLDNDAIQYNDACGRNPVNGLIEFARNHHLTARTVDLRNSGDTAGPKDKVVGYGAYVFEPEN